MITLRKYKWLPARLVRALGAVDLPAADDKAIQDFAAAVYRKRGATPALKALARANKAMSQIVHDS